MKRREWEDGLASVEAKKHFDGEYLMALCRHGLSYVIGRHLALPFLYCGARFHEGEDANHAQGPGAGRGEAHSERGKIRS